MRHVLIMAGSELLNVKKSGKESKRMLVGRILQELVRMGFPKEVLREWLEDCRNNSPSQQLQNFITEAPIGYGWEKWMEKILQ